jgi:hypothetical protein
MRNVGTRKEPKSKLIKIRVTPDEKLIMIARANRFFDGSISAMVRYAVATIIPPVTSTVKKKKGRK